MDSLRQIDAEIIALDARREELIRERERMMAEERREEAAVLPLSPDGKISRFLSLFRCGSDVYPRLWENPKDGHK
jgi:hypothetical protein